MNKLDELADTLANLDEEKAIAITKESLESGVDPMKILDMCRKGIVIVGDRFEKEEYFLSEMIMAAEIFKQVMNLIKPKLKKITEKPLGKIVIGTVQGDVHDIGKNIVISLLEASGFEVHDIGIDAPPEKFLSSIKEFKPEIVGMSCLLTLSIKSMKRTVEAIEKSNLRDNLKIIIGGGRVDKDACDYVKADAYSDSAPKGVAICKKWVGGV